MTATGGSGSRCDSQRYEIRLRGHLDPRWSGRFEDMTLTHLPDGTTTLTGTLADQSALHGLLNRVRDIGVPIISIRQVCPAPGEQGHD